MEHPNKSLIRMFYDARARQDLSAIAECFTDDAVWRYPGRNPLAGEYRGKEEVASFFGKLQELTDRNFGTEAHHVLANDDVAVVYELPHGTRKGKTLEWDALLLFRIREGRIPEGKVFQHIQHELDEFWS